MIMIPLAWPDGSFDLIVVLEDENLERMREYDPAEIKWRDLGKFSQYRPKTIQIGYGTSEDVKKISELSQQGKVAEAIKLVSRGWKYRPEAGDHDFGPVSLTKKRN